MEITAILIVLLLVVAGVAYFVMRRAIKWAIRLALLGVLVILLLAGGIAWWWYTPGDTEAPGRRNTNTGGATPARKR